MLALVLKRTEFKWSRKHPTGNLLHKAASTGNSCHGNREKSSQLEKASTVANMHHNQGLIDILEIYQDRKVKNGQFRPSYYTF